MTDSTNLKILHLVTAEEIFFKQQIQTLESKGVSCDVCVVPGSDQIDGNMGTSRGVKEYLQYFPKVRHALRNGSYDLVHANYGLTLPFAATQRKLPVVVTLWGSDVVGFDGKITKTFLIRADAVTVRSEEMRQLLGYEAAHILPSGIDMNRFCPIDRTTACERVGWDPDDAHVLFPYSPSYERKNYPLAESVVNTAKQNLDRPINLQTISGVSHEDVPYYMNAADVMLLTSKHEGSPNTVKEAMACNIPVVSTPVGDVRERLAGVSPGGVGATESELVALVEDVLSNPTRSNGREAVQEVSWDRIGDQIIEIYQSVLRD